MLEERGVSTEARLLHLLHLATQLGELLAHGRHHLGDGLLTLIEVAARALLELFHGEPGLVEEVLPIALQCLGRERLEGLEKLRASLLQEPQLLLSGA